MKSTAEVVPPEAESPRADSAPPTPAPRADELLGPLIEPLLEQTRTQTQMMQVLIQNQRAVEALQRTLPPPQQLPSSYAATSWEPPAEGHFPAQPGPRQSPPSGTRKINRVDRKIGVSQPQLVLEPPPEAEPLHPYAQQPLQAPSRARPASASRVRLEATRAVTSDSSPK